MELRWRTKTTKEEAYTTEEQLSDVQVRLMMQEEIIANLQEIVSRFAGQPGSGGFSFENT